jgi:hypothetical protein
MHRYACNDPIIMAIITPTTRGRIIGLYQHPTSPKSARSIAKLLLKPKSSYRSVINHFHRCGHVHILPRPGRPPKLNPAAEQRLMQAIDRDTFAKSDIFGAVVGLSGRQVQRIAHKMVYTTE